MPPGTLYLRLDAGKGLAFRGAQPQSLFCVLGVGPTRYRSAPASPGSCQWNENFKFTITSEPQMAVECWMTTAAGEQLLGSASVAMIRVTGQQDSTIHAELKDPQGAAVGTLEVFHAFRPSGGSHSQATDPKPAAPFQADPIFSNPYAVPLSTAGSSQGPANPYAAPAPATPFDSPYHNSAPAYFSAPPTSQQPSYSPAYPPPHAGQQPALASHSSTPQASKVPAGASYYAPPGVPAGYAGASSSSGLPPAGYPAPPPVAHPGQFYAGKPAKFGKPSKYSGMGGVGAGVAAGAVTGIAAAALLGGLGRPHRFGFKHKGFGFKGPKGFGFKGPKGFGFKGPKGFGFGKGFGWKD